MDVSQAVILSVVEGLSEFLPISSTGHLILASDILRIPQIEFVKSFEIIIQLGATLAIIIYTPLGCVSLTPLGITNMVYYSISEP